MLDVFKGFHTKDHDVVRSVILMSVTTNDGFKTSTTHIRSDFKSVVLGVYQKISYYI